MKISTDLRRLLIPAAWLSTAALTFAIGRLTSAPAPAASGSSATKTAGAFSLDEDSTAPAYNRGNGGGGEGGRPTGSATGAIEEFTAGLPVDEWLKKLMSKDDEIVRMTGFMRLLEMLNTPEDLEKALEAVQATGRGGARSSEYSMLLQKWAQIDPASAMAYVDKQTDMGSKFMGQRAVLATWTRTNPQQAIDWAAALLKNAGEPGAAEGASRQGIFAMAMVIGQLSKTDPDWALRLAEGQPALRGRTTDGLVSRLVDQRGGEKTRETIMALTDPSLRDSMIAELSDRLSKKDPAAVSQWVMQLPDGDGKNRAVRELIDNWSKNSPVEAAAFLSTLPATAAYDDSRSRLARNVVRTDPESALAWAGSITTEKTRTDTINEVVHSWMRKDDAAAKQWVAASQLPEETKTKLLTAPAPNQGGNNFRGRGGPRGQ